MYHNYEVMFEELLSQNGLSLDRLKNFCLVAETGGISRACNGNASKQALISRQIRELETFFGADLIRRKGSGIELTASGIELASQARLHFQGMQDFKARCANLPIEFRIAAGNSVLEWLVVPCIGQITRAATGSTFTLIDLRSKDVVQGLLDHTVDFGIVRKSAVVKPLKFRSLGKCGYSLFVPLQLCEQSKIPPSVPLAISVGGEFLQSFAQATKACKHPPNVVYRCSSFPLAANLARAGVAAAVLPDIARSSLSTIAPPVAVPWFKTVYRDLGIAWHDRLTDVRPGAHRLRIELESCLREEIEKCQV